MSTQVGLDCWFREYRTGETETEGESDQETHTSSGAMLTRPCGHESFMSLLGASISSSIMSVSSTR